MSDIKQSKDNLPGLSIGETDTLMKYNVSSSDIETYEKIYRKQVNDGEVDMDTKFRYAWCLVHSKELFQVRRSVLLLEELFQRGNEQTKRDSLFYLAVAQTKLKEYTKAKKYITAFLSVEPSNVQAQQLEAYIASNLKWDGIAGMAILGGAAIVGGAAAVVIGGVFIATGIGAAIVKLKSSISKK